MFVMSLPFSDALFCQIFPRECTETFQEGHRRAFEFFGAVPKRITYDNTKIAVAKVIQKRGGVFTREFLRLESHYLFEHHFCLVRSGRTRRGTWKASWVTRGGTSWCPCRNWTISSSSTKVWLEDCRQELHRQVARARRIPRRNFWKKIAGRCCRCPRIPLKPDASSLARPIRSRWSASTGTTIRCRPQHAHHAVVAIGGIERVRFVVQDQVVAEHLRDWDKENVHYDPVHYLALLERKPGALDFGKPFDDWDLPEGFGVLRRRLEGELGNDGRREFIKVLRLLESCELAGTGQGRGSCAGDRGVDGRGHPPLVAGRSRNTGEVLPLGRSATSARPCGSAASTGLVRRPTKRGGLP